ncbi:MAG TPA: CPBP family intramembrane glutamic endopeptidase [Verrucomicrobiae bacterium]|jgi:membrane protease YdiL (CAAX protease family)|nr:CPBP family intramembrane glutamic endopeptidase [Verrucomicrobiae bacterium]
MLKVIVPENPEVPGSCAAPTQHRHPRVRWWVHLVIIGSYPIIIGLLSLGRSGPQQPALAQNAPGLLHACAFQLGVFGLIFLLGWVASRASAEDLWLPWRPGLWPIPLGIGYSIGLRVALGLVAAFVMICLLLSRFIKPDDLQHLAQQNQPDVRALVDVRALRNDPLYYWLNLTLVSFVVAGLREELWRAGVLAALKKLWPTLFGSRPGEIAAVGMAAAIFGFGHVSQGPVAIAAAALLGFGLGTIMVVHRSIWPAVIAHGFFDATTFAVLPWLFEKLPHLR